ncbi:MAG TPA: hypothetical protein VGM19_12325 [Armatimonadota bacterium]|jgi:hypothetical protein
MKLKLILALFALTLSAVTLAAPPAPLVVDQPAAGTNWGSNSPNNPIVATLEPAGGPQGAPARAFTYKQGGEAWLPYQPATPLRSGAKLSFWLQGNGTSDQIRLYANSGQGHRGWDLDLSGTEWKQFTIDLSWNWDREESGRNATQGSLFEPALTGFKLYNWGKCTAGAAPFRLAQLQLLPPAPAEKPAVLFLASWFLGGGVKEIGVADDLRRAGFEVEAHPYDERGSGRYTFRDELAQFNVVVLLAALPLTPEGGYDAFNQRLVEDLKWFVAQGGGLFLVPNGEYFGLTAGATNRFLSEFGGGAELLDEQIVDASTQVLSTPFPWPFSYTTNLTPSPLTAGVRGLWYPSQTFGPGARFTAPVRFGPEWQVLARGAKTASVVGGKPYQDEPKPDFPSEPPFFGVREYGGGRLALLPMGANVSFVGGLHPAWSGITWGKGLGDKPGDLDKLAINTLRWLAEPSFKSAALGGYREPPREADKPAPPAPLDWTTARFPDPGARKSYRGLVGAVSTHGGGESTVAAYAAAATAAGLDFLIFTDPLEKIRATDWKTLSDECKAASTDKLVVIPGLQYLDTQGNHYLVYGNFAWPDPEILGEVLSPDQTRVKDTYKWTGRTGWRTVAIHSLQKNPNRVLDLRHYGAVAVQIWEGAKLVEDDYPQFLLLEENTQYPMPIVVHFLQRAADLAAASSTGLQLRVWANDQAGLRSFVDQDWSGTYFANPQRCYLSSGPTLDDWSEINMNSWRPDAAGTDRWQARARLSSRAPITELTVMDGTRVYRQFRPNQASVEEILRGLHGPQHQFTLRAKDAAGGELIASQLKTHTMVHVAFSCADRQNWLGQGTMGYKLWPASYNVELQVDLDKYFPPMWDGQGAGFGGLAAVAVDAADGKSGDEANPWRTGATRRLLFASHDCTVTEQVTDQIYNPGFNYGDCQPTASTRPATYLRQRLLTTHYRINPNADGFLKIEGQLEALRDVQLKQPELGVIGLQQGEKATPGSLLFATYPVDGRQVVRYVPPGTDLGFGGSSRLRAGDYIARYPRTLGAPALFAQSDNLQGTVWYMKSDGMGAGLLLNTPSTQLHQGDKFDYRVLAMASLATLNEGNADFERARRGFGLDGGSTGYTLKLERGALVSQQYELRLQAQGGRVALALSKTDLPAPLPLVVLGLSGNLPGIFYDRDSKELRRFTVFEGVGYLCTELPRDRRLFVGSPVTISDPALIVDVADYSAQSLTLEIHNPTAQAITAQLATLPEFDLVPVQKQAVTVPAGSSVLITLGAK